MGPCGEEGMRCVRCGSEGARYALSFARAAFCRECYVSRFERKLRSTVLKYGMHRVMRRTLVAVSGGKDSVALLAGLKRAFGDLDLTALYIDLGIPNYSERSEEVVRRVCERLGVPLMVHELKSSEGVSIPELAVGRFRRKPCAVCGTVKRHVLNRIAVENGFDTVATGHNLDDTVEVLFELYRRGLLEEAARLRPVLLGNGANLANRVKPLFEMTDEEDLYYVDALELEHVDSWCPLVRGSRMVSRKQLVLEIESKIPGFRHTLLKAHVKRVLPLLDAAVPRVETRPCKSCGQPTTSDVCAYCRTVTGLKARAPGPGG
ncbi:MAG: tRNA 2-thiocytidine biosynthesis TtcA family protein [Thaumarchaeota archaeon]|nr:tRNA 2-thiocytidine biosynthesis TtcA family protein [Candidatus Calditenuaceae archaeon]